MVYGSWMTNTKWALPIGDRTIPGSTDYIHSTFFIHFGVQVINAILQHLAHPGYIFFIILLHGPVLLCIVAINQASHKLVVKKLIPTTELSVSILWPLGGLTMHRTKSISDDVHLALSGSAIHVVQSFGWFLLYLLFSGGQIDDALMEGAVYDHLTSFGGLLKNVVAQAFWINVILFATHLFLPAYPSDASCLLAGALSLIGKPTSKALAFVTDSAGSIVAGVIVLVGLYQALFDDQNGIGIFLFMNYLLLLLSSFQWVYAIFINSEGVDDHPVVGRPCYTEIEDDGQPRQDQTVIGNGTNSTYKMNGEDHGELHDLELTETSGNGNDGEPPAKEDNFVV